MQATTICVLSCCKKWLNPLLFANVEFFFKAADAKLPCKCILMLIFYYNILKMATYRNNVDISYIP